MDSTRLLRLGSATFGLLLILAHPARANLLVNGGFEDYSTAWAQGSDVLPGWATTASDHTMEIWGNGFMEVPSFEGEEFMELNATQQATVYQDVSGITAGDLITLSFAHRGRVTDESMQVTLTDLGEDGIYGTDDDIVLYSGVYTDGTSAWTSYTVSVEATTSDTLRLAFESLTEGSYGNFIDDVSLTTGPIDAPEPGAWAALLLLAAGSYGSTVWRRHGGLRRMASR